MYCMNIIRLQSTFLDGELVLYHFIEKRFLNTTFKIMNIMSRGNLGRVQGNTIYGKGDHEDALA